MKLKPIYFMFFAAVMLHSRGIAQSAENAPASHSGSFSLGLRSTLSLFDSDGAGLGTGGQYRIQISNRVNTDWFADYISINVSNKVRSEYIHIGWSVLYYPFPNRQYPKLLQPYILAGHCFDYNKKTSMRDPSISKDRLGSAVQAGVGTHFNLSERFDISLMCQYMIHFTKELEATIEGDNVSIEAVKNSSLEGHLLTTISLNYKIFWLWRK